MLVKEICSTFSESHNNLSDIVDKSVALAAANDIAAFQGIQLMKPSESDGTVIEADTNMSDDDLAFKQAKERGELTQDELAYFEWAGYDCSGISIKS